jgi:hypothetical protein
MPKAEQTEIPGTETPRIKAIENAADRYNEAKEAFQQASDTVQKQKDKLLEVCQANVDDMPVNGEGDRVYKYDGLLVVLSDKANVKVKRAPEPDDE